MLGRVQFALAFGLMAGVAFLAGCGGGPSTSTAAEGHTGQIQGHTGGSHALGANPEAEQARIKKAAPSSKGRPQQLPGR